MCEIATWCFRLPGSECVSAPGRLGSLEVTKVNPSPVLSNHSSTLQHVSLSPLLFHWRDSGLSPRDIRVIGAAQPCCPVKYTYFLLLEASFTEVLASLYRVPRTQNQPRNPCPHGIWKWLCSMTPSSATCWLADVNQTLHTLNSLSSPCVKRDQ